MTAVPIPKYKSSCIATDESSNSFHLVGSQTPEILEVNYVASIDATTVSQLATRKDSVWNVAAGKACFAHPSPMIPNKAVSILQFGEARTAGTYFQGGVITKPSDGSVNTPSNTTVSIAFSSPKLLAWSGSSAQFTVFTMFTNYTWVDASQWAGLGLNFQELGSNLMSYNISMFPTSTPLIALGTYTMSNTPTTSGHMIVFDKNNQAKGYVVTGDVSTEKIPLVTLSGGSAVNMNSIELSSSAFQITMGETGYILDKDPNGNSVVIYSITPKSAFNLKPVEFTSPAPPFHTSMSGAALGTKIITYTSPDVGNAYFNSFDTTTGKWSGGGLSSGNGPGPGSGLVGDGESKSSTPIGAIVGGTVGGLAIIALAIFVFIRHRRQSGQKPAESTQEAKIQEIPVVASDAKIEEADHGNPPYSQYVPPAQDHSQQNQGYFPPPPPVNRDAEVSYNAYSPGSGLTEYGISGHSQTAADSPYVSPSSYRDSTPIPENRQSGQALIHNPQSGHSAVDSPQSGQPIVHNPQSGQPVVHSPQSGLPVVHSPQSGLPVVHSPQSGQPVVHSPQSGQPVVHSPQFGQPVVHNPQSGQPIVHSPQSGQPTMNSPQFGHSSMLIPQYGQPIQHNPQSGHHIIHGPQFAQPVMNDPQFVQPMANSQQSINPEAHAPHSIQPIVHNPHSIPPIHAPQSVSKILTPVFDNRPPQSFSNTTEYH
ncbi:hypothetical protein FBU30_005489 [Linnemannia zychae]|nr:hypothetical protein FBU30_005489 [Linnemannia zychae]